MKTIKEIKARMQPGVRLVCIENTYRPELNGTERVVERARSADVIYRANGPNGQRFYSHWESGITIIDADTFQMPLRRGGDAIGHVRLRFLDNGGLQ